MKRPGHGIIILVACILIVLITHVFMFITGPRTPPRPIMLEITPGTSAWEISKKLEHEGIISDASMFMAVAVITGKINRLQAGTYVFEGRHYPLDIILILFKGRTLKYRITIPEGSNIYDIGAIIAETGLLSRQDFIESALSAETIEFFDIKAPSMEGFLYPDTYYLAPHMTPLEIMAKMVTRFHAACGPDLQEQLDELGMTFSEVVTLASIIQKEAVSPAEKPIISSVFHNRLKHRMPLQSDPTAIYGIDGFRRKILPQDLKRDNPYNTYKCRGLPPGPICNPDLESIQAALRPAKTGYLYFVSKGNGSHHFSKTYQEHNRAIQMGRAVRK